MSTRAEDGDVGFSLIEVIAAMTVLALLAVAMSASLRTSRPAAQLARTGGTIATALKDARSSAVRTSRSVVVAIDLDKRLISRSDLPGGRPISIGDGMHLAAITAESETAQRGLVGIRFFPNGSSTGGAVSLTQRERALRIEVNWFTGHVETSTARR